MSFDFGGAKLDPVADKDTVEWILNQFLYGEVTGIQCGHWLYAAPDINAAKFIAKQAVEELQHVDNFLRMLMMMDMAPKPAHRLVRFLSTGMMPNNWAEHVAIEMAAGEGFVLVAFYALMDILNHEPSVQILQRAVKQEERHVEFGEQQTLKAIAGRPALRRRLLGLNLVSLWSVARLGRFIEKHLANDHPLLRQIPQFLEHTRRCAELRLQRMGLLSKPLDQMGLMSKCMRVAEAYLYKIPEMVVATVAIPIKAALLPLRIFPRFRTRQRLTESYLRDPHVVDFRSLPLTRLARDRDETAA